MKLSLYTDDLVETPVDLLAVGVFSDEPDRGLAYATLNRVLDGALERACRDEDFQGRSAQTVVFNVAGGLRPRRVLVFGYGERKQYGGEAVRRFAGTAARVCRTVGAASCGLVLTIGDLPAPPEVVIELVRGLGEGVLLGNYTYSAYRTKEPRLSPLKEARIVFAAEDVQGLKGAMLRDALGFGRTLAEATCFARDLVNEPANSLNPSTLSEHARRLAKQVGLEVKILGARELEKQGMGLLLGVGRGSDSEPRLIHLTHAPEKPRAGAPVITLVGKGLTFDSGGLSIKPSDSMTTMKCDMGGAAAVLGAMKAIGELRPRCVVHGIIAAAENMPDGKAIRPGDVLRSKKGLTVEVANTDAEGRLALADAIAYALELGPTDLIDLATLTGACVVALGPLTAGVFMDDEDVARDLAGAFERSGERYWRMPLERELREQLNSDIADIKNLGERWGGAITAALFLQEFVDDGVARWAHVDIAGPVLSSKESGYTPKGGTGFGVRTLVEYVMARAAWERATVPPG